MHASATIRMIALLEGAKGVVVLLAGFGLLTLMHRDLQHLAGVALLHLHMNPNGRYSQIFLDAASRTNDTRLMTYAGIAAAYSAFRLIEAYGLWKERRWAEWVAAASGGIYIPFEIYEVAGGRGWIAVAALALNIAILGVMVRALRHRQRLRFAPPPS